MKRILIMIIIAMLMATSVFGYHYVCLSYGEEIPHKKCDQWCCMNICVTENNFPTNPNFCLDEQPCGCGGSGSVADQEAPTITIQQPADNLVTSSSSVQFKVFLDETASIYYFDNLDSRRGYKKICTRCTSFDSKIRFSEGTHTVTIKAQDTSGNVRLQNVTFTVDSNIPRIRATYPEDGEYANGDFSVQYDEDALEQVNLYYKQGQGDFTKVPLTDCPIGTRVECTVHVPNLQNGELTYKFEVMDKATSVFSDEASVVVDTQPPALDISSPLADYYDDRRVNFDILIGSELLPVEIGYVDNSDKRPKYKRLCKNCMEYNKAQSFSDGFHNVTISATDGAGNFVTQNILFAVDSKAPSISRIYPHEGEYANGAFTVEYSEDALDKVYFYYKQGSDSVFTKLEVHGCPSDRRASCTVQVPNLANGELIYRFEVADKAASDLSDETTVIVDTEPPHMEVISPLEPYYNDLRVDFNIKVTDEPLPVEIGYVDNSDMRPRYKRLCKNCVEYDRAQSFSDGFHNVTISATDGAGNFVTQEVRFFVDSNAPKITGTYPDTRDYGNGTFTVEYSEEYPVEVRLTYMQDGVNKTETKTGCPGGRRESCSIKVPNLKEGPVTYFFSIVDIAGASVTSRKVESNIDTVPPEMIITSPVPGVTYDSRVGFIVDLTNEKGTIEYMDLSDNRPSFRRLCSHCDQYDRSRTFREGSHEVIIRASDVAGNTAETTVNFEVQR